MAIVAAGECGQGTLVEVQPFKYDIVEKSKHEGVLMTLEGVMQRADTKNANKRVYPRSLWQKIVKDEDVNSRLESRRMLGELDHPASGATSLSRVSHIITSQELKSNGEVRGTIDILDTPAGRIAETMFKAGVQLGISSRGDGSVEQKDGFSEVQSDFRLETYDLVLKPSTPGAFPQVAESVEEAQRNVEMIADAVEELVETSSDVRVLLECHKIISALEGCESRREAVQNKLTEKLTLSSAEPPPEDSKDVDMSNKNTQVTGGGDLSPELAALIREHADAIVAEKLTEKDAEINRLNQIIVALTQDKEEIETRLGAAEELIEEFQRKVEELKDNQTQDEDLKKKHEAALLLIDEATSRLQEFKETQRRLDAAKSLLAASIDRHKHEAVEKAIQSVIGELPESAQEKLRPILETCSDPDEVQARYKEVQDLIETFAPQGQQREPLPIRGQSITETNDEKKNKKHVHSDFVTRRLMSRIAGVR